MENNFIDEINDPRNGLLKKDFHALLEPGFMKVRHPISHLTVTFSDFSPLIPDPKFRLGHKWCSSIASSLSGLLTLHYFRDSDPTLPIFAPFDQDARPPADLTHWSPSILTDFV